MLRKNITNKHLLANQLPCSGQSSHSNDFEKITWKEMTQEPFVSRDNKRDNDWLQ